MSKRRIVVFDRVSADGYFAGPDGNLNWAVPDDALDRAAVEGGWQVDAMLFGRRTYDMFENFWPNVVKEGATASDPHASGRTSAAITAMAKWINDTTKLVFSRTRKEVTWKNSRLLGELDPRAVEDLKSESGKDIIMFGSGSIVSQLTEHGLIDEYRLIVNPVLLGSGRSLVRGLGKSTLLRLEEAKTYDSGNVMLTYTRKK
jgi:dihydrofolate reductase